MAAVLSSEPAPEETRARPACAEEPAGLKGYLLRGLPSDLLWCLAIAVFLTLLMGPFMSISGWRWLLLLLLNSIISISIGLAVANSFRFLLPPLQRRFPGRIANLLAHVGIAVFGTAVGVELAVRIVDAIGSIEAINLRRDAFRIGLVIVIAVLAIDLTYERLRRQARRDELRAQEAHRRALRAELKALQARTNPHFLFNSLNTAAGLIEEDPAAAEQVIERLAELFRYSLRGSETSWVRLREEVEAVRKYLEVEAVRLGDRLRSEIELPPEAAELLVPPLVLQPLVENAVLHGVAPRRGGGRVRVAAARRDSALILSVSDDGDGPGSSGHSGTGTSLEELRSRLELLYGGDATFRAGAGSNGGFEVTLSLPVEQPA